jgi:2-methylcitrate dehydratase PrpD
LPDTRGNASRQKAARRDAVELLARNVVNVEYQDMPAEAVALTKAGILDTLGTLVAGAHAPGCDGLVGMVRRWGGVGESSILIHGGCAPAHNAALVNSAMARALDFDDVITGGVHSGASAVPIALAMAQRQGAVGGREFLTAICLGEDVAARLHMSITDRGFDHTGICMAMGGAAIAGKILGLDEEKMCHALGIAFNMAAGSYQSNADGSLMVRVIQGLASCSAIQAALLADEDITGPREVLEGQYGFINLFSGPGSNPQALTEGLGKVFQGARNLSFKLFPSCGCTIPATEAILDLVHEHPIDPEAIDKIEVTASPFTYSLVGHPFSPGETPQVDAQFSLPYTVANAIVRKNSLLEHFTAKSVRDPQVIALASRVHVVADSTLLGEGYDPGAVRMKVRMKDGTGYDLFANHRRGRPQNPASKEVLAKKFHNCVAFNGDPLWMERAGEIAALVARLDKVADVRRIAELLSP